MSCANFQWLLNIVGRKNRRRVVVSIKDTVTIAGARRTQYYTRLPDDSTTRPFSIIATSPGRRLAVGLVYRSSSQVDCAPSSQVQVVPLGLILPWAPF